MRSPRLVLAAAIALAFIVGCVNYDETVRLKADGSGTIEIHYSTAKSNVPSDTSQMSVLPAQFVFEEAKAKEMWTGPGVTMQSFRTEEKIEAADTVVHAYMTLAFDKLASLAAPIEGFKNRSGTVSLAEGVTVSMTVGDNEGAEVDTTDTFKFKYTVVMPSKVMETNGTKVDDTTVRWEYSSSQIKNKQFTLSVKSEAAAKFPILIVVIAAVVVVAIIVIVVVLGGKKKTPAPAA